MPPVLVESLFLRKHDAEEKGMNMTHVGRRHIIGLDDAPEDDLQQPRPAESAVLAPRKRCTEQCSCQSSACQPVICTISSEAMPFTVRA